MEIKNIFLASTVLLSVVSDDDIVYADDSVSNNNTTLNDNDKLEIQYYIISKKDIDNKNILKMLNEIHN